jgi:hypothetical protein
MLYLFVALFFFFDAVLIHLLVCRNGKEGGLLLKIFFLIAGVNLVLCWMAFFALAKFFPFSGIMFMPLVYSSTAMYVLLIPTYLVFYFSTQQMSPSKKIMLLLLNHNLSSIELSEHFTDEEWIMPRLKDLITTKCVVEKNETYALTFSGIQMARVYALYQAVLGRTKGG